MAMTRAQLNQAFREVASMEFADIPCDEAQIQFNFSDKFTQKMEKLIARQKKPYWEYMNTAGKKIAIVAILVLSITVTVFSNEEVRASMLRWCEDVYEEYIEYFFQGDTTTEIFHEYQLTSIPSGFDKVSQIEDVGIRIVKYSNDEEDIIKFEQYATKGYSYVVDNEKAKVSTITVRGIEVKLYEYERELMGAMWVEDGYYMSLTYYGCEDIEVVKKLIESIE